MDVLRVPPYPLITKWNLPEANYTYAVSIEDLVDYSFEDTTLTSDSNGVVTYSIPASKLQFDRELLITFYDTAKENVIYESNLDIVRPYVNPVDLATSGTASEIAEYKKWEIIARSLIDTYTNTNFYNRKTVLHVIGNGLDYMPVWLDIARVLKGYENNVLIFDAEAEDPLTNIYNLKLSPDKTAIIKMPVEEENLIETTLPNLPISRGDLWEDGRRQGLFQNGYDFTFVIEEGPRNIPSDIQYATEMLIDDLKCGKLDYYQRYVTSYNTDQFRIQFDKSILNGTGNVIVDKILDKYVKSITRVGVL
jgi:hypothetical protein